MKIRNFRMMVFVLIGVLFNLTSVYAETAEEYFSRTGNAYVIENGKFTRVAVQKPVPSVETKETIDSATGQKAPGGISNKYKQANVLYPEAMKLVNSGQLDAGLALLKKTTTIAPEEPDMHSNYASVLFVKGQQLMKAGQMGRGVAVFNEIESELLTAIRLYQANPSKDIGNFKIAQCNFLLGDVYYYMYADQGGAKLLYQKSLGYYPGYEDALKALSRYQ